MTGAGEPFRLSMVVVDRAASYSYQMSRYGLVSKGLSTPLRGVNFIRSKKHVTGVYK
jgi:hypothetical protein